MEKQVNKRDFILTVNCKLCNNEHNLYVNTSDYYNWIEGKLVQRCFPYLSAGDRELLISGVCNDCFNNMFNVKEN